MIASATTVASEDLDGILGVKALSFAEVKYNLPNSFFFDLVF